MIDIVTALTVLIYIAGFLILTARLGPAYDAYRRTVRRWL